MSPDRKQSIGMTARNADRHMLYEISVQQPQVMVSFIEDFCEACDLPDPMMLREDFSGTANLASWFIKMGEDRRAICVDNDPEVVAWARDHNKAGLGDDADRMELILGDVFDCHEKADVLVTLNYSHFIFKEREKLLAYFKHVHSCLNQDGLFFFDVWGGTAAFEPCRDARNFGEFKYIWEQTAWDPETKDINCAIHFHFNNGTKMNNAFTYSWRLWSIDEIKVILGEAGFSDLDVYYESEDGFSPDFEDAHPEAWVAYLVAMK